MQALNQLFKALKVQANVYHNGLYYGSWAVDTSGRGSTSFHLVTYGQCVVDVDGQRYELIEGDAIFLPSDAHHVISDSFDNDAKVNEQTSLPMCGASLDSGTGLVCGNLINHHPLGASLMSSLPAAIVVRKSEQNSCASLIALILVEARKAEESACFLLDHLADALFFVLIRDHASASDGLLAAMLHPKLKLAIELIHQGTEQRYSNEQLADAVAMSRSSFAAQFKEVVGIPPAEYQVQWHMLRVYRLLVDEKISTLDAAIQSGYEGEASFAKAFKRVIGIGPGEARKQSVS